LYFCDESFIYFYYKLYSVAGYKNVSENSRISNSDAVTVTDCCAKGD